MRRIFRFDGDGDGDVICCDVVSDGMRWDGVFRESFGYTLLLLYLSIYLSGCVWKVGLSCYFLCLPSTIVYIP